MKYLFRTYQWLIAAPIFIVLTFITAVITIVMSAVAGNRTWGYWPAHIWSRCVCTLLFVRVRVYGRENIDKKSSYVFVANHQGAFDIWAIYGYLNHNFKWLMKKSLEKIFMVGFACKSSGHVFVDSNSLVSIKETIEDARKRLKNGMSLVIFPEGSRSWDGSMRDFKRGAFLLASEFRLPVVPVTIDGAFKVMPRTTYNVTPGTIKLTIHKPIEPGENGFNTKKLLAECYDTIGSALPYPKDGNSRSASEDINK